jgi:hypothetical protein
MITWLVLVGELLEKYQFALTIAEHERDCYARAAITKIDRRQRGKAVASAVFKKEHGNIMVWDKASMALKKQFDDLRQATKDAAELKKQQEKEDKAKEGRTRDITSSKEGSCCRS